MLWLVFQIMAVDDLMDEETGLEHSGSQSDRKTSLSTNCPDVLSVNQLLDSVKTCVLLFLLSSWLGCDRILKPFFLLLLESGYYISPSLKDDMGLFLWIGFGNCTASCKFLHFLDSFTLWSNEEPVWGTCNRETTEDVSHSQLQASTGE